MTVRNSEPQWPAPDGDGTVPVTGQPHAVEPLTMADEYDPTMGLWVEWTPGKRTLIRQGPLPLIDLPIVELLGDLRGLLMDAGFSADEQEVFATGPVVWDVVEVETNRRLVTVSFTDGFTPSRVRLLVSDQSAITNTDSRLPSPGVMSNRALRAYGFEHDDMSYQGHTNGVFSELAVWENIRPIENTGLRDHQRHADFMAGFNKGLREQVA